MNKIVYAAPVLAAIAFSNVASAAGAAPTFSIPTFYSQISTVVTEFTGLQGDVTGLNTDVQNNYNSSVFQGGGSYVGQLGLYNSGFEYCIQNPSNCTSAELAIAQTGQEQYNAAMAIINDTTKIPAPATLESTLSNLAGQIGTLDTNDVNSVKNNLDQVNAYAQAAQGYAEQLASSNAGVSATLKGSRAAATAPAKAASAPAVKK